MLWTIFVILLVLWLFGLVTSYTLGGSSISSPLSRWSSSSFSFFKAVAHSLE